VRPKQKHIGLDARFAAIPASFKLDRRIAHRREADMFLLGSRNSLTICSISDAIAWCSRLVVRCS